MNHSKINIYQLTGSQLALAAKWWVLHYVNKATTFWDHFLKMIFLLGVNSMSEAITAMTNF